MAVNIMHQLDESHNLQSGLGGSIVSKINMAIVGLGGEAHEGTIQDRYKILKALADETINDRLDDIRTDLAALVTTAGGTVADDDTIEDIIDMIASVTLNS